MKTVPKKMEVLVEVMLRQLFFTLTTSALTATGLSLVLLMIIIWTHFASIIWTKKLIMGIVLRQKGIVSGPWVELLSTINIVNKLRFVSIKVLLNSCFLGWTFILECSTFLSILRSTVQIRSGYHSSFIHVRSPVRSLNFLDLNVIHKCLG